ncbi:MAG: hypothetical protein J6A51_03960, partial [Clostridia bacterium]|nr:hypothetical protein [Clostridia bacterium]
AIVISVAVSEFLGRCFENASMDEERKEFNFETGTYDSEKNGKLSSVKNTEDDRIENLKNAKSIKNTQKAVNSRKNSIKNAKEGAR